MHERPERERQPRVPRALRDRIDFEMILKFRAISPKSLASAAVMLLPYQLLLLESPYSELFEQPVLIHLSMIRLDAVKSGTLQRNSELTMNGDDFDDSDFPAFLTGANFFTWSLQSIKLSPLIDFFSISITISFRSTRGRRRPTMTTMMK